MEFGNKGIQMTFKFDEGQLKAITQFIFKHLEDAKKDFETDLEITNDRIDKLHDKIERLSR